MVAFTATTTGEEVVKEFIVQAKGKTVLVTGPSKSGIGAQTAIEFATGKPQVIILASRNKGKIQPVIDQIQKSYPEVKGIFAQLDLGDLSSVRKAAEEISGKIQKLDVLINNAGIMALKDYATTKDGIEMQFGANHVGHFLLTNLLTPKVLAAGNGARIVNVSSFGYLSGGARFDDPNFLSGDEYNPWLTYGQSKTANILFAAALASKLSSKGVLSFSLHPGSLQLTYPTPPIITESKLMVNVSQELFAVGYETVTKGLGGNKMPTSAVSPKSLAAGSATSIYAALDPELASHNGAFLVDTAIWTEPLREYAVGVDKAEKLWALSEKLVGEKFDY